MIPVDLAIFFLIGLLGGAHCIGMCGPLVTVYAGRLNDRTGERGDHLTTYEVRQHALFNVGRTAGYATIGGAFGLLGGVVFLTADSVAVFSDVVRGSIGVVVGAIVILIGIQYVIGRTGVLNAHVPGLGTSRVTRALSARVDKWVGGPGILGLGAIHGLLPCPILYPAFLYVFAMGSLWYGFVSLAALGLGTIPAVFLYGTIVETIDPTRRRQLHRVLGVMFIVLGYIPLSHGLMLFGFPLPHPDIPFYQPLDGIGHDHH